MAKKPPQPTNIKESLLGGAKAPEGMRPNKPDLRGAGADLKLV